MQCSDLSTKALFSSIAGNDLNWHARLRHPSESKLNKVARRANINCTIVSLPPKCVVCPLVNTHKLPSVSSTSRSMKPFNLIYADLWTSPIVSVTTAKYFLLLIDYTKYMWIFFHYNKSQTKVVMDLFKAMVEK